MQYCTLCVMPDTMPNKEFHRDGVCSACHNYRDRTRVDWNGRKRELVDILERYRCRSGSGWDCIIPVSGGKDSIYQVVQIKKLGYNPLCVTVTPCDPSELGRKNLTVMRDLGVDHVEFTCNRHACSTLNRITLREIGDISWPEHAAMFAQVAKMAIRFKTPLIIWGENSLNEDGGPVSTTENNLLTGEWIKRFGGLLGLEPEHLIGREGLTQSDIMPYTQANDEELAAAGVTALFLGYYIPWDSYTNCVIAQSYGFNSYHTIVEGSCLGYEHLDTYHTGIHDYFRYLKHGYGRAASQACAYVRRGRLTREQACDIVRRLDGAFPWSYLGKPLEGILAKINMTVDEFQAICDRFTNRDLFQTDANGNLIKDNAARPLLRRYPDERDLSIIPN